MLPSRLRAPMNTNGLLRRSVSLVAVSFLVWLTSSCAFFSQDPCNRIGSQYIMICASHSHVKVWRLTFNLGGSGYEASDSDGVFWRSACCRMQILCSAAVLGKSILGALVRGHWFIKLWAHQGLDDSLEREKRKGDWATREQIVSVSMQLVEVALISFSNSCFPGTSAPRATA